MKFRSLVQISDFRTKFKIEMTTSSLLKPPSKIAPMKFWFVHRSADRNKQLFDKSKKVKVGESQKNFNEKRTRTI